MDVLLGQVEGGFDGPETSEQKWQWEMPKSVTETLKPYGEHGI